MQLFRRIIRLPKGPKYLRSIFKKPAGNFYHSKKELIGGNFI
jgi:hypothetical protein